MAVKVLISRFTSAFYREDRPEGTTHYTKGQVIKIGDESMPIGRFWREGGKARVVNLPNLLLSSAEFLAEPEYADATDLAEWQITLEEGGTAPLIRKRKYIIDIDALEALYAPLADSDEITIEAGQENNLLSIAVESPKTRWTKADYDASLGRKHSAQ